jgi:ABC-2 type transport system ATP-binding protein
VKTWRGRSTPVLDGVDLEIESGVTVSISGVNGAGKTTMLRIASGLITADRGQVSVGGLDPERNRAAFQRRVGFLTAGNSGLYGRLKAEHHLDFWAHLALLPRRQRAPAIARTAGMFGLEPLLGQRVDRLSMGQRQRVRLAFAFLHEPSLVMLDEPATSLDQEGISILQGALDQHQASGGSAVVCLPSGWEEMIRVDRTLTLSAGRLESHR